MTKIDEMIEFGNLHMRTCGGSEALDFLTEETILTQRCKTCGASLAIELSFDETQALRGLLLDDTAFSAAMHRAGRRIVQ
jgi:hypothetical protein